MHVLRLAAASGLALVLSVAATATFAAGPDDILPEAPAKALIVSACTGCHQAPMIVAKRRTAEEWDDVIAKMVDRGAALSEEQQDEVYDYLVKNFGPETAPAPAPAPAPEGERGR